MCSDPEETCPNDLATAVQSPALSDHRWILLFLFGFSFRDKLCLVVEQILAGFFCVFMAHPRPYSGHGASWERP